MTSCLPTLPSHPLLVLARYHVEFCDNDVVAGAVLSFLGYFHGIKKEIVKKNTQSNKIAKAHGDAELHDVTLLQFHTYEEIRERIMGIGGITSIRKAINLLKAKGVITIHRNPNKRYGFDKTNYYLFHPDVVYAWLQNNENYTQVIDNTESLNSTDRDAKIDNIESLDVTDRCDKIDNIESPDVTDRSDENNRRSAAGNRPSVKSKHTITKSTTKTTSKTPVINQSECVDKKMKEALTELEGNIQTCLLGRGFIQHYCTTKGLSALAALVTAGDYSVKQIGELFTDILRRKSPDEIQLNYLVTVLNNKRSAQSSYSQPGEISVANTSSGLDVIDRLGEEGA